MTGLNFTTMNTIIYENSVNYLFGNYIILGVAVTLFFMVLLLSSGIDFKSAIAFSLPLITLITFTGWLGAQDWIINVLLIVIAILYARALVKIWS